MKQLILTLTFIGGCFLLHSQTLNLEIGSSLQSDAQIFNDKILSKAPRPFVFVGASYTHTTGVSIALTYNIDLGYISLSNKIPLWNVNKQRYKYTFSLINNNGIRN